MTTKTSTKPSPLDILASFQSRGIAAVEAEIVAMEAMMPQLTARYHAGSAMARAGLGDICDGAGAALSEARSRLESLREERGQERFFSAVRQVAGMLREMPDLIASRDIAESKIAGFDPTLVEATERRYQGADASYDGLPVEHTPFVCRHGLLTPGRMPCRSEDCLDSCAVFRRKLAEFVELRQVLHRHETQVSNLNAVIAQTLAEHPVIGELLASVNR